MFRGLYVLLVLGLLAGAGMFWAGKVALATPADTPAVAAASNTCCSYVKVCDLCSDPGCPLSQSVQGCADCCAACCPDCPDCPVCCPDCCPGCSGGK